MIGIISVIFLVLVTSFFVSIEFALVSVRKTRIEQLASEGSATAVLVKHALENLNKHLAAAQVGITMATLGLGTLGEPVVAQLIVPPLEAILPHDMLEGFLTAHGIAFIIALLLVTTVELIIGENVPKIASIQRAEQASLILIRPLRFFMFLFRPFIWIINILTSAVLRMVGLPQDDVHASVYTVEELEMLVTSSRKAGVLDRDEEAILRRVFDFGDLTARQVMRPRTELIGIPSDATLSDVTQIMTQHRFSRFPVYDGDLDKIIGVLHVKDVFAFLAQVASGADAAVHIGDGTTTVTSPQEGTHSVSFNVTALMRKIDAVPESLGVGELMSRMQQSNVQMIQVVDEYGGTAGVVTLEDIVEEIVGEVGDEFDPGDSASGITVTPEGTLIDGLVAIDDVNDALGLKIESESDTLGGFVFDELGRKPEVGDEVKRNGFILRVEALDNLRIAKVRVLANNRSNDDAEQE